ncbi:Multidrug resistance-associated protein 1 [Geranomyces variabilis]|uniref:Multidrug resistance-associated protein 1 n=1 Tax=Geranomyces variabilis TaxID=109894 RepID=A0AAD5TFH5_9FUNG|nr:Multidrug resistance-associated protein 1 [Geranomyces variabilis]
MSTIPAVVTHSELASRDGKVVKDIQLEAIDPPREKPSADDKRSTDNQDEIKEPYLIRRNLFSYVSLSWLNPLLRVGSKHALAEDDLPSFPHESSAQSLSAVLAPFWQALDVYTVRGAKGQPPNFAWALARHFMPRFILAALMQCFVVACAIIQPLLINQVIKVIDPSADHSGLLFSSAYAYGALYLAMSLASAIVVYTRYSITLDFSIETRSTIIGAVYAKVFRLSLATRRAMSPGALNSFVNADVAKISHITSQFIVLGSALLQMGLAIYFLARTLGVSTWLTAGIYIAMSVGTTFVGPRAADATDVYMDFMDGRTKGIRELIYGIRTLKMEGAEKQVAKEIDAVRECQLAALRSVQRWLALVLLFMVVQQDAIPTIAIVAFRAFGGRLTASNAFTILGFLAALSGPASQVQGTFMWISGALPSISRINAFLTQEEAAEGDVTQVDASRGANVPALVMEDASFSFGSKSDDSAEFKLSNISMSIPKGSFVAVVGATGSGKSAFMSAITGSMALTSGKSEVNGTIGYCPQDPWILSGSIESNIRGFAGRGGVSAVASAVAATCLDRDISILPQGLKTRIGEKGVSLSGGQKARVSLARAIASDADIYALDDPLAALDARVGRTIFEQTLRGRLKGKTIVLATHQLHVVREADIVIVLENGRIAEMGPFAELNSIPGGALAKLTASLSSHEAEPIEQQAASEESAEETESAAVKKDTLAAVEQFETSQVVEEDRREGYVKPAVYLSYFRTAGWISFVPFVMFPVSVTATALAQILLVVWSSDSYGWTDEAYFIVYASIGSAHTIITLLTGLTFLVICYRAGKLYHQHALHGLVNAPVGWYDHQPAGRILNRMSTDVSELDTEQATLITTAGRNFVDVGGSVVVLAYGSPYMLILFAVLLAPATLLFRYFQPSYREIKRLASVLQSPLSAHVSETVGGISTIKVYNWVDSFIRRQEETTDKSNKAAMLLFTVQFWLLLRLSLLSAFIVFFAMILAGAGLVSSATSGLMLVSAINISALINDALRDIGDMEASFNSVERLEHYAYHLPKERSIGTAKVDAAWPSAGAIKFEKFTVGYSIDLPPVIKDLSLDIPAGEHIAIVGRTGAGKTSLCAALFRLMEATSGSIAIDGQNIADIDLDTLRKRLVIVPQEPLLSSGTIRSNLDRHGEFSESAIWHALDLVGMKEFVSTQELKLEAPVTEGGANLSSGQRQLLVLAKSILIQNLRVLVLDESTAAVDGEGDLRIGELIRDHFKGTTVICIAHRLASIADFDRVAVMAQGQLVEVGTPAELLDNADGEFAGMVAATGPGNAARIREIADKKRNQL